MGIKSQQILMTFGYLYWSSGTQKLLAWKMKRNIEIFIFTEQTDAHTALYTYIAMYENKTKSLKSCEGGELKSKRWMVIKVDWWLKSIDD